MLELADIVRAAGPEVCARLAVLPSQKRALEAILQCRTAALGGQAFVCDRCGAALYSYHSCGNRNCPKCHGQQTAEWLKAQRARLLPCAYYLLTFTLPAEVRPLARSHQKIVYGVLIKSAAAAVQTLCKDPQWLGAQPSLLGVLHTWTRALLYHPHAHFLVSAGGLSPDGKAWLDAKHPGFFLPVRALSRIFQGKVRAGLAAAGLLSGLPAGLWSKKKKWVVHAQPAGEGDKVLEYLGRYVFRIAIANSRLESLQDGQVTFRYRDNRTQQFKRVTLSAADFLQRFLQHVLPKGLPKVRHYGLDGSACGARRETALALLVARSHGPSPESAMPPAEVVREASETPTAPLCPHCHKGHLIWVGRIGPPKKIPP
jgi:hypothetical protein